MKEAGVWDVMMESIQGKLWHLACTITQSQVTLHATKAGRPALTTKPTALCMAEASSLWCTNRSQGACGMHALTVTGLAGHSL